MKLEPVSYVVDEDSDEYGALSSDEEQLDDPLLQDTRHGDVGGHGDVIGGHGDVISGHGDVMQRAEEEEGESDDDFEKEMNDEIMKSMHSFFQVNDILHGNMLWTS